jgi:hypothetical protein
LEALQRLGLFGLSSDDIHDRVHQLGALSVETLGPVVAGTGLTGNEVIRAVDVAKRTRSNSVKSSRLKVDSDSTGNILLVGSLVKKNVETVGLKFGSVRAQVSIGIKSMLVSNGVPKRGGNLVSRMKKRKLVRVR